METNRVPDPSPLREDKNQYDYVTPSQFNINIQDNLDATNTEDNTDTTTPIPVRDTTALSSHETATNPYDVEEVIWGQLCTPRWHFNYYHDTFFLICSQ